MFERWQGGWDKRNSPRLAVRFPVTVLEADVSSDNQPTPGPNSYLAKAVASKALGANISQGGLAFEATKPYRVGTILGFEVVLPEPEEDFLPLIRRLVDRQMKCFRALCQVAWVGLASPGKYRMGVRFIDSNDARSLALGQLVSEYRWQQRLIRSAQDPENRLNGYGGHREDF